MKEDQIKNLIDAIIEQKLKDFKDKNLGLRRWNPQASVTDQFSPITGASQQIGFFGSTKIAKPTVTGSKGANAALTSLMTALSNLGLVTNSTS